MVNRIIVLILIALISSCNKKELDAQSYMNWVNDYENGLIKTETIDKVKYTVAYRPVDYTLANNILSKDTTGHFINHTLKHHSFIIKMEPVDGKSQILTIDAHQQQEPFQRMNYYLNEAQNHIMLIESGDTLAVSNFHYERYYNLSPSQCLIAGFDQNEDLGKGDLKLVIEDKIFNTGKIAFYFSQSQLNEIPILNP